MTGKRLNSCILPTIHSSATSRWPIPGVIRGCGYQKQIIDTFVNSVYVYDDRLVKTYNYKNGTETISLDAVHQAFGSDLSSDAPPLNQSERAGFSRSRVVT